MFRIETKGRDEHTRSIHHQPAGVPWRFDTEAEARDALTRLAGRPLDAWVVGPAGDALAHDCMEAM